MNSPRPAASLACALFVTGLSTTALAGGSPAPDSGHGDAPRAVDGTVDRALSRGRETAFAPTDALPTEPPEAVWYGGQILLADGASIALAYPTFGFTILGLGWWGPFIHWSHGHPGRAAGSFGLRVGMGIVGAIVGADIGMEAGQGSGEDCGTRSGGECGGERSGATVMYGVIGLAVGLVGASVIDATVLAWDDAPAPALASTGLRVAPSLAVVEGGGTLGIVGVF